MARPTNSDSAVVHARILAVATTMIDDVGPTAVTMREIARLSNVSLGTVHYYFKDKETLLEAVFDQVFAALYQLRDELVAALSVEASPPAIMENAVRTGYRTAVRMRAASRLTQMMALDRGFIPERRRLEEDALLDAVSVVAPAALGVAPTQARLLVKSLIFCVGRYATQSCEELRRLIGAGDHIPDAEVHAVVEEHLVAMMRGLLR